MKKAVDESLFIPHSTKRFPDYDSESQEFITEVYQKHIMEYCRLYQLPNGRKWRCLQETIISTHKEQRTPDIMEELSKNAHAAIGESLAYEKKAQEKS